ncbi:zinc-finger homeodomain protein 4 [Solanum dulcamara]|uniref:zinc-finger homeodomain protein 4 n=1 Tax=Solanum dulcamara TaxID=45834 RepID=UPI002486B384|nr:zinc-finger homeodomain protein 4 [Solanum dulcamara]
MELPSQDEDMPLPINSTYVGGGHGHGHMIHHDPTPPNNTNHIIPPSMNGPPIDAPPVATAADHHVPFKKMVRYKECLKNHAASMGGNATDGCGEFMPSGEEGSIEAFICSACNCHRNFHRKEIEGDLQQHLQLPSSCDCFHHLNRGGSTKKVYLGHNKSSSTLLGPEPFGTIIPTRPMPPHHQMIMSYNMGSLPNSESEEHDGGIMAMARPLHHVKKRFRTKFTQEQKDKMLNFAEKVGWKIQKQEEAVVQQFCQEVGVKRRVLKVWMHNNKHSLAKKNPNSTIPNENQV